MIITKKLSAALGGAVALAVITLAASGLAQQQPSAESIEMAKQIIQLKSGDTVFNALIPGVIEQGRYMFEQQNPNLSNDLRTVATKLRAEFAPRQAELNTEVAKIYASAFTDKEMKDLLAFYQSPLGRKLIVEEPRALDKSMAFAQTWSRGFSDEVLRRMREEMKKLGHDI